jgi:hypothetical protein
MYRNSGIREARREIPKKVEEIKELVNLFRTFPLWHHQRMPLVHPSAQPTQQIQPASSMRNVFRLVKLPHSTHQSSHVAIAPVTVITLMILQNKAAPKKIEIIRNNHQAFGM